MIDWLLDTNAVIALLTGRSETLLRRVEACTPGSLGLSSVVVHELYYGAYRSRKVAHNLETLRLLLADFAVLEFGREDARVAGEIRAQLARLGLPIGPYDVLIAGQAKAREIGVVTGNVGEFGRVEGLRVEDWAAGA